MYYFEGNYRNAPQQNLAGASRVEGKAELINRVKSERKKREERRVKENCAIVIQSIVRGFLTRRRCKTKFEIEFDDKVGRTKEFTLNEVIFLIRRLPYLGITTYSNRLKSITEIVLQNKEIILSEVKNDIWIWRMKLLLHYNILQLSNDQTADPSSVNFIETFTNIEHITTFIDEDEAKNCIKKLFTYTVNKNYYNVFLKLLLQVQNGQFDPPVDRAYCLMLFTRPFLSLDFIRDESYEEVVLTKFCEMINKMEKDEKHLTTLKLLCAELKALRFPFLEYLRSIFKLQTSNHCTLLLYSVLLLDNNYPMSEYEDINLYFKLLSVLSKTLCNINNVNSMMKTASDADSDVEEEQQEEQYEEFNVLKECALLLNDNQMAENWISYFSVMVKNEYWESLIDYASCLHNMLLADNLPVHRNKIFMTMAQNQYFLKGFWKCVAQLKRISTFSSSIQLINLLTKGSFLEKDESLQLIPSLTMFAYFMKLCYSAMTEEEFYSDKNLTENTDKPFSLNEMVILSRTLKDISVGIILLAYPDTLGRGTDQFIQFHVPTDNLDYNVKCWSRLLQEMVGLTSLLQSRDARRRFTNEGHWISNFIRIPESFRVFDSTKFVSLKPFIYNRNNDSHLIDNCIVLSTNDSRYMYILNNIPFTVPFLKRFTMLQNHFEADKLEFQNPQTHYLQAPHHFVRIRRDFMYEDAFDKLSEHNALDLKQRVKIHMVNTCGLDEPGVDGGGVFREFMTELLKTAFDPNRGFFIYNNDNELYPNPSVHVLCNNYERHYSFIGRILGKAIYEGIMSEIPMTDFFLAKLTSNNTELYLNNLASLDPELYNNILKLQRFHGDFSELGLDFTTYTNEYGRSVCRELKPNGSNIAVTSENVAEYIDLITKYKMHEGIGTQTQHFIEGLHSVFSLDLLKMFTPRELQIIISGDEEPIDIEDMKRNTVYTGGFTAEHPSIIMFWNVLNSFSSQERSQVLKFVTSYSRPPLLGFKELHPPICIQCVDGINERFPTSSTCMHLLKLPAFSDENILRAKLLFAIQSGAGFELS